MVGRSGKPAQISGVRALNPSLYKTKPRRNNEKQNQSRLGGYAASVPLYPRDRRHALRRVGRDDEPFGEQDDLPVGVPCARRRDPRVLAVVFMYGRRDARVRAEGGDQTLGLCDRDQPARLLLLLYRQHHSDEGRLFRV